MFFKLLMRYGLWGSILLFRDVVKTRLFYPSARIVRSSFRVRGKRHIDFGTNLTTGVGCRIDAFPDEEKVCVKFGADVQINDFVHIAGLKSVSIGNRVLIASHVFVSDHNHGCYDQSEGNTSPLIAPEKRALLSKPVVIEDDVWLGEYVSILPGVTIGKGVVIGAGSVVTANIPAYTVAVGSPAKVIKHYDFEKNKWLSV